jgi:hypothetical protein
MINKIKKSQILKYKIKKNIAIKLKKRKTIPDILFIENARDFKILPPSNGFIGKRLKRFIIEHQVAPAANRGFFVK